MDMSVRAEGLRHAQVHKWIQSQIAQRDLGEAAIEDWIQRHWDSFLRARWVEHLEGTAYWAELGPEQFGFLKRKFQDKTPLLERIADFLKAGKENLEVLLWMIDWHLNRDDVLAILEELDINNKRLIQLFDPANPLRV